MTSRSPCRARGFAGTPEADRSWLAHPSKLCARAWHPTSGSSLAHSHHRHRRGCTAQLKTARCSVVEHQGEARTTNRPRGNPRAWGLAGTPEDPRCCWCYCARWHPRCVGSPTFGNWLGPTLQCGRLRFDWPGRQEFAPGPLPCRRC